MSWEIDGKASGNVIATLGLIDMARRFDNISLVPDMQAYVIQTRFAFVLPRRGGLKGHQKLCQIWSIKNNTKSFAEHL